MMKYLFVICLAALLTHKCRDYTAAMNIEL